MMVRTDGKTLPDLWKATYGLVAQVPRGRVTTYGAIAEALGDVVASRFVGLAMSASEDTDRVPCWRVVQSTGYVGAFSCGGPETKCRLLRREGVKISGKSVGNLSRHMFVDFESEHPLRGLRRRQRRMRKKLSLRRPEGVRFERVAGIDVAYAGDHAFAAMVVFEIHSGAEVSRVVLEGDAPFPYIPTYLAFREIPVIAGLMKDFDETTVVMYDGNGVLHPEGFGVASQVGVEFGVATIGVAKTLLCGSPSGRRIAEAKEVLLDNEMVGYHLSKMPGKGVFVSAGHGISQAEALDISTRFLVKRIPEPTRAAHIAADAARRATRHK